MDNHQLATISTGITVPVTYTKFINDYPTLVIAHGLGARSPKLKNHLNDEWTKILIHSALSNDYSHLIYTARGHGESTGWQESAEYNLNQFSWSSLADDMISLVFNYKISSFVACGSSMGAATSLYTALKHPARIAGLIMVRPPTTWEERKARRNVLISSANRLQKNSDPSDKFHFVLRGAALTDLPSLDDDVYDNVTCPVLILTVKGDDTHPVSTAQRLAERIIQTQLYVANSTDEADSTWPEIISNFLFSINNQICASKHDLTS
jgi:pimeloyl-ACP methyl ester carboxylesterase